MTSFSKRTRTRDGRNSLATVASLAGVAVVLAAAASSSAAKAPAGALAANRPPPPLQQLLQFAATHKRALKPWRIAIISQAVGPDYTNASNAAAAKRAQSFGVKTQLFDGRFNPNAQAKALQDAITLNFDGYLIAPVSGAAMCNQVKQLVAQGKPVVIIDNPICGDNDYTKGTVAYAGYLDQQYENRQFDTAFSLCEKQFKTCTAGIITGVPGFDLQVRIEKGVKFAAARHTKVKVIFNQPGFYDEQKSFRLAQDAIAAHPEINVWVTSDDSMSAGVIAAAKQARQDPTKLVIVSQACDTRGKKLVKQGLIDADICGFPVQEANYGMDALIRFLETGKKTPGYINVCLSPKALKQLGRNCLLTKANVDRWIPEYKGGG